MRPILYFGLVIIGAVLFACARSRQNPRLIVFDDWWNVDYVKSGCQIKPCPIGRTPNDIVTGFENELELAFASESACHGISLIHFTPDMASAAVKNPNAPATGAMAKAAGADWSFMLDLDGNSETQEGQGWTLVDSASHATNGTITSPQGVMQQVCQIVKRVGGRVEN